VEVTASSKMSYASRMLQYMRAGARVNSRVKLEVEWEERGETHQAVGYTVDVSPKGCLAIVPQGFAVGQTFRLKNWSNSRQSEATLIWRGHEGLSGWELGLELVNPPEGFWGVEF
jgi:hypothetical protein